MGGPVAGRRLPPYPQFIASHGLSFRGEPVSVSEAFSCFAGHLRGRRRGEIYRDERKSRNLFASPQKSYPPMRANPLCSNRIAVHNSVQNMAGFRNKENRSPFTRNFYFRVWRGGGSESGSHGRYPGFTPTHTSSQSKYRRIGPRWRCGGGVAGSGRFPDSGAFASSSECSGSAVMAHSRPPTRIWGRDLNYPHDGHRSGDISPALRATTFPPMPRPRPDMPPRPKL